MAISTRGAFKRNAQSCHGVASAPPDQKAVFVEIFDHET